MFVKILIFIFAFLIMHQLFVQANLIEGFKAKNKAQKKINISKSASAPATAISTTTGMNVDKMREIEKILKEIENEKKRCQNEINLQKSKIKNLEEQLANVEKNEADIDLDMEE